MKVTQSLTRFGVKVVPPEFLTKQPKDKESQEALREIKDMLA